MGQVSDVAIFSQFYTYIMYIYFSECMLSRVVGSFQYLPVLSYIYI